MKTSDHSLSIGEMHFPGPPQENFSGLGDSPNPLGSPTPYLAKLSPIYHAWFLAISTLLWPPKTQPALAICAYSEPQGLMGGGWLQCTGIGLLSKTMRLYRCVPRPLYQSLRWALLPPFSGSPERFVSSAGIHQPTLFARSRARTAAQL